MNIEKRFHELISTNKRQILSICRYYSRINQILTADDLFQEIVLALWGSYPKFIKQDNCKESTWVYRVALNVSISQSRKNKFKFANIDDADASNIPDENDNETAILHLYELIKQLNQEEQVLLYLYIDSKSHKEISDILGISVTNVGTKIQRIKSKLKILNDGKR